MSLRYWIGVWGLLCSIATSVSADVVVHDFLGREVRLAQPAERIVALSPHLVENLYSAGVGDRLAGTVAHSDYPPAAAKLPRVGGYTSFSLEAIVALNPDLVVAWASAPGGSQAALQRLQSLDIPVYIDRPRKLADIARAIEDLGTLGGRGDHARRVAAKFRQRLDALRRHYAHREPVTMLYQVWNEPLQTLSGDHFIGNVIRLCGGRNAFADAVTLAPKISIESVLARDPQAIVASGMGASRPEWLDEWRQWPGLRAVQNDDLYYVPPDLIQRPTLRILDGAQRLCRRLQRVRAR